MQLFTLNFSLLTWKISLRKELRIALLAGMETCWVSSIIAFLALMLGFTRSISPLTLFAAYWIALMVGRVLPARKERWVFLQLAAIGIAILTMIAAARIDLYPHVGLLDLSWLPNYGRAFFSLTNGMSPEHLAGAGVAYAFIRGLAFSQRPMTLWFTGFQFRLGIVFFFLLFFVAAFAKPFDPARWLVAYFFISLLAIALARIEEMESDVRLGPRWAVTLLLSVIFVIFLGLLVTQLANVDTATAFLQFFTPLWIVVEIIFVILLVPLSIIVSWMFDLLAPFVKSLLSFVTPAQNVSLDETSEYLWRLQEHLSLFQSLIPLGKVLFVLAIFFGVGFLIARALNRRMKQLEDEEYIREAIGEDEQWALRAGMPKRQAGVRRSQRHIAAETIRRIYAALVARAADAGLPRRVAETPYEFLPRLQQQWQDQADDLRAITEAYVEVHYAEHDVAPEQMNRVREMWKRLEKILKHEK